MEITFLGTGTSQGIPVIGSNHKVCLSVDKKDKRLRSSILIKSKNTCLVIDCGPDFRQQMLQENPNNIDGLLFTHEHSDHTSGLDDVRPLYFKQGFFSIYTTKRVLKSLQKRFSYIFETENKYPGTPTLKVHIIENNVNFYVKNLKITPIEVLHGNLPILGFRIYNFVYLTDVKKMESSEIKKLKNIDILVVNALRKEEHHSHFCLQEALQFIEKIKPKKAYLTHVSHLLGFHEEVDKSLPKNVFLAYDNLTLTL